jgi:hypothetical protein
MRSIPLMMTIIGIAFSLIILGLYLYQTAPENNTTNLPESASIVLPAVNPDEDTSDGISGETSDGISGEAPDKDQSDDAVTDPVLSDTVSLTVDLVNVSPDGTVVISGQAAPHSQISILINENMMATAKANAKGDWVAVPDHPLAPGSHLLTIRSKDPNGVETMADMAVIIVIPDNMDETPLVALVPVDEASDQMAQLLSSPFTDEGESQITVSDAPAVTPELPQDAAPNDQPPTGEDASSSVEPAVVIPKITIRMIEAISPERMAVSGFIVGEGSVKVSIGNIVATTSIDDDGYMAKGDIPAENRFPVAVTLSDADGALLSSARIVLNKSKLDETLSGNALIVVQKGDALWRIAYKTYGQGIRYVDIYQSNQTEIGDPNLIYPDQVFVVPNP